jgi:DNA-binding SARP family transcriptional activator
MDRTHRRQHNMRVMGEPQGGLDDRPRFMLLGRVSIEVGGHEVRVTPTALTVLVRLLLARGRPVPVDELYRDVWPDDVRKVGRDERVKVHKRITELRQALDLEHRSGQEKYLVTERGPVAAYRVATDSVNVDMYLFEDLVADHGGDDPEKVGEQLERALALWQDRPLLGVADIPFVRAAVTRLSGLRDMACAGLLDAYRQLGRAGLTLPTLARLSAIHPSDESLQRLTGQVRAEVAAMAPGRSGTSSEPRGHRPPGSLPEVWNVPIRMTGSLARPVPLAALRESLTRGRVVLSGLPGVGKTRLAVEYAHESADQYRLIWWLDAENLETVGDQLGQLAVRAGAVGAQADTPIRVAAAKQYLRGLDPNEWLLIYDNVEDPYGIREFLPDGNGHTVLTSRSPAWTETAIVLPVDVFSREESVALLGQRVAGLTANDADGIADQLGDLPLALAQAAGLMADEQLTGPEYLAQLQADTGGAADAGRSPSYPSTLGAAIRLSMRRLSTVDASAAHLMHVCSFLASEVVPTALLDGAGDETASRAVRRSLAHLARLGLARLQSDGVQLHRLTAAIVREEIE